MGPKRLVLCAWVCTCLVIIAIIILCLFIWYYITNSIVPITKRRLVEIDGRIVEVGMEGIFQPLNNGQPQQPTIISEQTNFASRVGANGELLSSSSIEEPSFSKFISLLFGGNSKDGL